MSELIKQGLEVSALGMGLTFAALGLLILTMMALERLFRVPESEEEVEAEITAVSPGEENEIAIAIAVALSQLQTTGSETAEIGKNLEAGRGAWWQVGRSRQRSRAPVRKTSRR